ncbi:hypothetical protein CFOL_v3_00561 [Cephalotus follicularis]|uniref:Uncharacterized protein n=1 Tax=Cephalotus follicularis TaxID=3775 RepID=A0A1Q3AN77_CEPFO|nr:hypothetical protein CFOL_v3_00561 [Cephalotus follicularis]
MVKTLKGEHLCVRAQSSKIATSKWIAKKIGPQLRVDRAKWLVREVLEGKYKDSYTRLPKCANLLKSENPGNMVEIKTHERIGRQLPIFKRIFICLYAMKRGFSKGCRPFFGLDGCHLKGSYGGILLAVVSVDGHNGLFPIAFAVVES